MTQLQHQGTGWKTKYDQKITITREDDNIYTFTHGSTAAEISRITLTARNSAGTVVLSIPSDTKSAQWTKTTNYEAIVSVLNTDTTGLGGGYTYDIEVYHSDGEYYTVEKGTFTIVTDVTYSSTTSPHESWDTRNTYDTLLNQYVAGFDRTFLSAAASGSDTDIDVVDASIFTASDDIRVILDDGTYTEVTIDTISTNNIDFSTSDPGGLASAAAAGNVVLKVV